MILTDNPIQSTQPGTLITTPFSGTTHGNSTTDTNDSIFLYLKKDLLTKALALNAPYEPNKVYARTDSLMCTKTDSQLTRERYQRSLTLDQCGLCSDPKEMGGYKPLHEPITDPTLLIYKSLDITPPEAQAGPSFFVEGMSSGSLKMGEGGESLLKRRKSVRPKTSLSRGLDGFELIKHSYNKSKERMSAIKAGRPATAVFLKDVIKSGFDVEPEPDLPEGVVDWEHALVDKDKQLLWTQAYIKHKGNIKTVPKITQYESLSPRKVAFATEYKSRSLSSGTSKQHTAKTQVYNMKLVQDTLNIHRTSSFEKTSQGFAHARDSFFENRTHINAELAQDLKFLDTERMDVFCSRFACFKLDTGKVHKDLSNMRENADANRKAKKSMILRKHAWFHDLLYKVVLVGLRRDVSQAEQLLVKVIQRIVETGQKFNKRVLVHVFKSVPDEDFEREEIQTIIRFIKLREGVNERDYIDALALSGKKVDDGLTPISRRASLATRQ